MEISKGEGYLLRERISWLIKLRWIAVLGVFLSISLARLLFLIDFATTPLYIITASLIVYNLVFSFWIYKIKKTESKNIILFNIVANLQIFIDLSFLAALIHFSGGVENPFIFYFIFHIIIAGILLSRWHAFLQTTYANLLFLVVVFCEYYEIIPHYCLIGVVPYTLHKEIVYVFGLSFVFISTLYIAGYMASSISKRLREREGKLSEANKLLEEKDYIKSQYVLRVTHDIKEDLAAIQSCIDPVTDGFTGDLNSQQANLLSRAKLRSQKLIFFVNSLLAITKMKLNKKIEKESFSLYRLLEEIAESMRLRTKNKGLNFEVKLDRAIADVIGVRVYLQEAITNILANAIKYTPSGGKVLFEAGLRNNLVLIKIQDDGIGIPKEDLSYVFDEFYRASNARKQEKQGTGLGLSLAKKVIQIHKGKIWVESQEGKGAIFFLELPKNSAKI
tara:strand:+ start:246 stop:1586 length:1341 start_codon:yes stop_codon:yes gene_type:complete